MAEQFTPEIMTELRKDIVRVPEIILEASGIKIFGKIDSFDHLYYGYRNHTKYKCKCSNCCVSFYTTSSNY